ncbi:MAG: glycosyltransferase family 4 protein, partial [Candidatus Paceibacteria bacterium]
IWELAEEFTNRGHEVTIYSGTYGENTTIFEDNIKIKNIPTPNLAGNINTLTSKVPFSKTIFNTESVSSSPGAAIERLFGRLVFSKRVAEDISKCPPDVIYLRDRVAGTFPARLDIPTIHTVKSPDACDFFYRSSISRHPANIILFHYKKFLEESVVDNSDWTFLMNEKMKENFESRGFSDTSVVSLGVKKRVIVDNVQKDRQKQILFVGRFDENKRPEWVIEAYDKLHYPDYELHFIGSGQRETYLRQITEQKDLTDSVIFHGRISREEVLSQMRKATVLVLPSEFENCPNVLIEAMASGCPVIASNTHGAQHLIRHQKNGLLFDKYDKRDLVRQLEVCLSNQKTRRDFAKKRCELHP